jgi:capsid protein
MPEVKPQDRLNFWDKTRAYFNPAQGLIRMRAREIEANIHEFSFGYNDSPTARSQSGGMYAHAGSETWKSARERYKMMWDARDLVMYDFIGGVIARLMIYVCGQLRSKSLTGDEQYDSLYDDFFHGWCGDEPSEDGSVRCDLSGRHRFLKLVQMAFWGFLVDGDHGILEVAPLESPNGEYCLQAIESDRLGSPLEQLTQEDYVNGITTDIQSGRVLSYRIFRRTRTNQYVEPREIPPEAFIHVHDPDKPDEYRGRTKLLRLLNDARDIREWVEAEKIAGKTQAQWAALVGVRDPYQNKSGAFAWTDKTPEGTPTQPAKWGQIMKMAEGEVFDMLAPPARPSGAFIAFVEMILRKMAVSLDLPYGFMWNLATLGGVTARIEVQQAQRRIEYWRNTLLIGKILNRVRQKVIANAIAMQILPPHPLWKKCEWNFGLSIQTDVGYEMESDIAALQTGIVPVNEVCSKYGHDPKEVFDSNATTANQAIMSGGEHAMPVEVFARGLYPDITVQRAAMVSGPVPPPEPGSIEALGDKGVKQLVDLLKAVGDGKIDADAAEQTLINTFGIPPAMAKKMVPEPDLSVIKALHPKPAAPGAGNGSKPGAAQKKRSKPAPARK